LGEQPDIWEGGGIILIITGLAILTMAGVGLGDEAPE
jgi:hypothetical protein